MVILTDELRNQVVGMLSFTKPMGEVTVRAEIYRGCLRGYSEEQVKDVLDDLHYRNEIRWVAFEGWLRGGRPS